jgi:hypothetical protein
LFKRDALIISIHQPNYLPWIGYFRKIAQSDVFVFLDDVLFSKGSYTNRVKVLANGEARWLSLPVKSKLGDRIDEVEPAKPNWRESHLSSIRNYYGKSPFFATVWPVLEEMILNAPENNIAQINGAIVEAICNALSLECTFVYSSNLNTGELSGDDRLISLLTGISPTATYLSGRGADNYQDPDKYLAVGLGFRYSDFQHPDYPQSGNKFVPGLSVIDLAMNVGWKQSGNIIKNN